MGITYFTLVDPESGYLHAYKSGPTGVLHINVTHLLINMFSVGYKPPLGITEDISEQEFNGYRNDILRKMDVI